MNLIVTSILGIMKGFRFENILAYIIGGIYITFIVLALGY